MTAMLTPGDMIALGVGVLSAIVAILAWWAALRANRIHREEIEEMRKAEKATERRHREELTLVRAQFAEDMARRAEETSRQAHLVSLDLLGDNPLRVEIKNRSTSPVFEVDIIDVLDPDEKKSWSWHNVPATRGRMTLESGEGKLYVLKRTVSVDYAVDYGLGGHDPNVMGVHPFERPQIVYGFRDAGGRRWWRLGGGSLWLTGAPVPADVSPWDGEKARIKARRGRTSKIIALPSERELFKNLSKGGAEGDPESGTL